MATLLQSSYTSIDGNNYAINVFLDSFQGDFFTPAGRATIVYPEIKDIMTVLRGSELDVQLELKKDELPLLDILSSVVGDREARGRLFKNGQTIFEGWLRPDSISYPLNTEYVIVNLSFTDGLGLLKETEYRNTDGTQYRGVENELLQLTRILQLTGSQIPFRIYNIGLIFSTEDSTDDDNRAINDTFTNQDRYRSQDQNNSVFDCQKVLEGILKKYGCCVFQHQNKWHIIKISRFFWQGFNGLVAEFDEYNSNGVLISSSSMGEEGEFKEFFIGSQAGGYSPFFCNADQNIKLNGTIGAYKVVYKYGILKSIITNSQIIFNNTAGSIDGWSVPQNNELIYQTSETPLRALLKGVQGNNIQAVRLEFPVNGGYEIDANTSLVLTFQGYFTPISLNDFTFCRAIVELWDINDQQNRVYLNNNGDWSNDPISSINISGNLISFSNPNLNTNFSKTNFNTIIEPSPTPFEGFLYIKLLAPQSFFGDVPIDPTKGVLYNFVGVEPNVITPQIIGESFTSRISGQPLMAKNILEEDFYTGDADADIYVGAITDFIGDSTLQWRRRLSTVVPPISTSKKLLEWLAWERQAIQKVNQKELSGSIRGFVPYLGSFVMPEIEPLIITDIQFMLTAYTYDTKTEQIKLKLTKIDDVYFSDDNDVDVEFNLESDEIVEPKIIG